MINQAILEQIAADFAPIVRITLTANTTSELTISQIAAGLAAYIDGAKAYTCQANFIKAISDALFGPGAYGIKGFTSLQDLGLTEISSNGALAEMHQATNKAERAAAAALLQKPALKFAANFDALTTAIFKGKTEAKWINTLENGKATSRRYIMHRLPKALEAAWQDPITPDAFGLSATPFAPYNEQGLRENGDSIYLSQQAAETSPSAIKIESTNISLATPYINTEMMEATGKAFATLANNLDILKTQGMDKARKTTNDTKRAMKAAGKAMAYTTELLPIPEAQIKTLTAGFDFLKENGSAYADYKIDDKGREYAIGGFHHFHSEILLPLMEDAELARKKLKKAGFTSERKYIDAAKQLINGDIAGARKFFAIERGENRFDRCFIQLTLKTSAIAASVVLAMLEEAEATNTTNQTEAA